MSKIYINSIDLKVVIASRPGVAIENVELSPEACAFLECQKGTRYSVFMDSSSPVPGDLHDLVANAFADEDERASYGGGVIKVFRDHCLIQVFLSEHSFESLLATITSPRTDMVVMINLAMMSPFCELQLGAKGALFNPEIEVGKTK